MGAAPPTGHGPWSWEDGANTLVEAAARRYASAGRVALGFARGKLRHDPAYLGLLRGGSLARAGVLLDLGCGAGILLALLAACRDREARGAWPSEWPPLPQGLELRGIERRASAVNRARRALGHDAEVALADLCEAVVPPCATAVLLDVLHYLDADSQENLLARVVEALEPGGALLIREVDGGEGWRARVTRAAERVRALGRGEPGQRFHYRSAREWVAIVERLGCTADVRPMRAGTPFANVLITARVAPA